MGLAETSLTQSTPRISIDTGVMVEYIDEAGDFHAEASTVVKSITSGKLLGLVAHPVLAELYYVSSRLYEKSEEKKQNIEPEQKAENLIKWIFGSPNILIQENTLELALEAGRIKKKYAFALTDSFVLAAAKLNRCKAVFKSLEDEMARGDKLGKLEKEEKIQLVFLKDYR